MKAVKLYKINWNLDDLTPEEREEAKKNLPTSKGFKADDNFDVVEKVPGLLYKKFGYKVADYAYTEIPIYEDFETLLKSYTPRGEKPKKIYLKSGELSDFGERVVNALKMDISKRFRLEGKGTADDAMSVQMDMIMLSLEKIFGIEWEEAESEDDIFAVIDKEINSHVKLSLKKMDDEDDEEPEEAYELPDEDKDDEDDDEKEEREEE